MILGMTPYTFVHTLISVIGIVSGFVVVFGLLASKSDNFWTAVFLSSMAVTCLTGFFFPFHGFKPSYGVGVLTLIAVILAYVARYRHHLAGGWRKTYVISAVIALYFNFFVLIVQSFLKVPALNMLAPTQTEPPFKIAQLVALVIFIALGVAGVKEFHVEPIR
jgi:hypothetical protein